MKRGLKMKRIIKKGIATVLVMGLVVGCMVGCGKNNEETNKESNQLVVYSPAPEAMLTSVIQEFQDKTGIKVELVQAGSGELLTRIKSESNNTMADVMFGSGAEAAEAYKDYFLPYQSPEAENVKENYKSDDGSWTGAYVSPTVIMYNKNLVLENEKPKGWKDFADEKWKGKLAFADPAISGSAFTTLSILLSAMDNGDGGWDYIKQYIDVMDGTILNSSSAPEKGVSDGEYAMCITQEQGALKYITAGAEHVGIVYPEEGTGAVPSTVSIVQNAPNEENAKKFVDFVLSSNVQQKLPEFFYHSTRDDITETGDVVPINEIKMTDFDFLNASVEKDAYIQKWNDIIIGK